MKKIKDFFGFYCIYVVLVTLVFKILQPENGTLVGFGYGVASYPIICYCYIIMSIKDKDERNGENTSNTCERENNNG